MTPSKLRTLGQAVSKLKDEVCIVTIRRQKLFVIFTLSIEFFSCHHKFEVCFCVGNKPINGFFVFAKGQYTAKLVNFK